MRWLLHSPTLACRKTAGRRTASGATQLGSKAGASQRVSVALERAKQLPRNRVPDLGSSSQGNSTPVLQIKSSAILNSQRHSDKLMLIALMLPLLALGHQSETLHSCCSLMPTKRHKTARHIDADFWPSRHHTLCPLRPPHRRRSCSRSRHNLVRSQQKSQSCHGAAPAAGLAIQGPRLVPHGGCLPDCTPGTYSLRYSVDCMSLLAQTSSCGAAKLLAVTRRLPSGEKTTCTWKHENSPRATVPSPPHTLDF